MSVERGRGGGRGGGGACFEGLVLCRAAPLVSVGGSSLRTTRRLSATSCGSRPLLLPRFTLSPPPPPRRLRLPLLCLQLGGRRRPAGRPFGRRHSARAGQGQRRADLCAGAPASRHAPLCQLQRRCRHGWLHGWGCVSVNKGMFGGAGSSSMVRRYWAGGQHADRPSPTHPLPSSPLRRRAHRPSHPRGQARTHHVRRGGGGGAHGALHTRAWRAAAAAAVLLTPHSLSTSHVHFPLPPTSLAPCVLLCSPVIQMSGGMLPISTPPSKLQKAPGGRGRGLCVCGGGLPTFLPAPRLRPCSPPPAAVQPVPLQRGPCPGHDKQHCICRTPPPPAPTPHTPCLSRRRQPPRRAGGPGRLLHSHQQQRLLPRRLLGHRRAVSGCSAAPGAHFAAKKTGRTLPKGTPALTPALRRPSLPAQPRPSLRLPAGPPTRWPTLRRTCPAATACRASSWRTGGTPSGDTCSASCGRGEGVWRQQCGRGTCAPGARPPLATHLLLPCMPPMHSPPTLPCLQVALLPRLLHGRHLLWQAGRGAGAAACHRHRRQHPPWLWLSLRPGPCLRPRLCGAHGLSGAAGALPPRQHLHWHRHPRSGRRRAVEAAPAGSLAAGAGTCVLAGGIGRPAARCSDSWRSPCCGLSAQRCAAAYVMSTPVGSTHSPSSPSSTPPAAAASD